MAANSKNTSPKKQNEELADVLFKKYLRSTIRTLGSTEFYDAFMAAMASADNEIQFSNRRMEKIVDTRWVEAVEQVLSAFQNIIENPRNIIREDELIVNVANAKKTGSDVVRHLATHASLVEDFNEMASDSDNVLDFFDDDGFLEQMLRDDSSLLEDYLLFVSAKVQKDVKLVF
jgi:hypothetical protein